MKTRAIIVTALLLGGAAGLFWAWSWSSASRLDRALEQVRAAGLLVPPPATGSSSADAAWRDVFARAAALGDFDEENVADEVLRYGDVLEAAADAAREGEARITVTSEEPGEPNAGVVIQVGRALKAQGARALDVGEAAAATATRAVETLVALARAMARSSVLLDQAIALHLVKSASELAARLLPHADDPMAIAAVVARAHPDDVVATGLAGEASFAHRVLVSDGSEGFQSAILESMGRRPAGGLDAVFLFFARPYLRDAIAEHFERLVEAEAACRRPFDEAIDEFARIEREAREGAPISRALYTSYGRFLEQEMTGLVRAEALRLGAVVLDYRARHGRIPGDLIELGDERPKDPRSGGDFLLTEEDGRLVVASAADEQVRLVF